MKIAQTNLSLAADHSLRQEYARQERLRAWSGGEGPPASGDGPAQPVPTAGTSQPLDAIANPGDVAEDPRLLTLRLVLEALTGRRIRTAAFSPEATRKAEPEPSAAGGSAPAAGVGWGVAYDLHQGYEEAERLDFTATGTVTTARGDQYEIGVELHMERLFTASRDLHFRAGDARFADPLAVNFAAPAASLTDTTVSFDLNGDGAAEEIPALAPGSGFLFLDRNGDGRATNGAELFGPSSGSGFAELATLDDDGNGWLDAGDSLFTRLGIWSRDQAGTDTFASLSSRNVGAISLALRQTPFALTDNANTRLGRIAATGIYLGEDGRAGTVQEIDLVV